MLFNSFEFLIFFPIVTLVYFLLPGRIQWIWLLVMSYFFYMNWHAEYALLMAACTVVTYACGRIITALPEKKHKKLAMLAGIVFNIGLLGYFKYTGFFLDVVQRVCNALSIPVTTPRVSILLPDRVLSGLPALRAQAAVMLRRGDRSGLHEAGALLKEFCEQEQGGLTDEA